MHETSPQRKGRSGSHKSGTSQVVHIVFVLCGLAAGLGKVAGDLVSLLLVVGEHFVYDGERGQGLSVPLNILEGSVMSI